MTTMMKIATMLGLLDRSFNPIAKKHYVNHKANDISNKRTPPRSMTVEEKAYYDKHKNLNKFYSEKP